MKKYITLLFFICLLAPMAAQDVVVMTLSDDGSPYEFRIGSGDLLAQNSKSGNKERTNTSSKLTFESLSDIKGIEVVYISKAMLGMMPNMNMPGVDMKATAGKLESLQILTAESGWAARRLSQDVDKLIKDGAYELLMLTKDGDSKTAFYNKKSADKKKSEIVMITEDDDEVTVIRFMGDVDIKDLKNVKGKK